MLDIKYLLITILNNSLLRKILKFFHIKFETTFEKILKNTNEIVLIRQNGQRVANPKIANLEVIFKGTNNCLEIYEPFEITKRLTIFFGSSGSKIKFGKNCKIRILGISVGLNCKIEFSEGLTSANTVIVANRSKDTTIKVGKNCMFSTSVHIRCTDSHVIYDKNTNEVLNYDKDVEIGDNVWLGHGATILKGAFIPSNCVVGACSLVNKSFDKQNCILAGNPAKIIRENICWDRKPVYKWPDFKSEDCLEFE